MIFMTIIHTAHQKIWHFPKKRHDSVYKKGTGWLLESDAVVPGLIVSDDKRTFDIDVHLPGKSKNTVSQYPCIKRNVGAIPSQEELIHVILPKK